MFHTLMFFKKVEKIYIELYSIKERFNKMETKMYFLFPKIRIIVIFAASITSAPLVC